MAKDNSPKPIKDVLERLLKMYQQKPSFNRVQVRVIWEKLMGTSISNYTERLFIRNNVLYIELSSAPLKQELSMSKSKILTTINQKLTTKLDGIVFL
jgi:predicted nucleic acid-binding Zn ribbon protein